MISFQMRVSMLFVSAVLGLGLTSPATAEEGSMPAFSRKQLSAVYFSEGANAGDLNRDGKPDVVCGPYWYEGPGFDKSHEIYPPQPQPLDFYADNFFSWVYDFNRDGWHDVLVVGFPGTPAHVYENPGEEEGHWPKHEVLEGVANESPQFVQVVGDDSPELVCTQGGLFGFATLPPEGGFGRWTFRPISDQAAPERFGHGLGVGDLSGDGLSDVLTAGGWFEQPAQDADRSRWRFHERRFTNAYGGADMHAYDVDGDGDNDVVTSLAAHDFGLAWYEQDQSGVETVFRQHIIMGQQPEQSRYGLVFTELHSVALVDMNGDGLKDIVTGKTYRSHHDRSPMWDVGAVVYWFELIRTEDGVDWAPHLMDGETGIGRQLSVQDINGDNLPDVIVGGMTGANVLIHSQTTASAADRENATPKPAPAWRFPLKRGSSALKDANQTSVGAAVEAESAQDVKVSEGQVSVQDMTGFLADRWSGGKQLFWTGGKPGNHLQTDFEVENAGEFEISAAFTMAPDYAVVRTLLDGEELRAAIDLFNYPDVISTGQLLLGIRRLEAGAHTFAIEIVGANPSATPAMLVGLDYLKIVAGKASSADPPVR